MEYSESSIDFWSLSSTQLAKECQAVADANPVIDEALQAEARRLYVGWIEALELPNHTIPDRSRRASLLASLRRRTIEILIKAGELQ
jgi:hypothetical protein